MATVWSFFESSSFLELGYDYQIQAKTIQQKYLSSGRQPSVRACIRLFWYYTKISEGISREKMLHAVSRKEREA